MGDTHELWLLRADMKTPEVSQQVPHLGFGSNAHGSKRVCEGERGKEMRNPFGRAYRAMPRCASEGLVQAFDADRVFRIGAGRRAMRRA